MYPLDFRIVIIKKGDCGSNAFQGYFDDAKESRVKQIPKIQESSFKNQDSRIIKIKIQDSRFKNQEKTQSR